MFCFACDACERLRSWNTEILDIVLSFNKLSFLKLPDTAPFHVASSGSMGRCEILSVPGGRERLKGFCSLTRPDGSLRRPCKCKELTAAA